MFVSADFENTPPELRWRCVQVPEGGELRGWLAALPMGVWVHWVGKGKKGADKPCVARLTHGKLLCRWCPRQPRGKWYVPIVQEHTLEQRVVLVPKTGFVKMPTIIVGMPLRFSRGKGETSPARVTSDCSSEAQMDSTAKRIGRGGRDVRPYLLHLWQIRELSEHFGQPFRPSITTEREGEESEFGGEFTLPMRAAAGLDSPRTSG